MLPCPGPTQELSRPREPTSYLFKDHCDHRIYSIFDKSQVSDDQAMLEAHRQLELLELFCEGQMITGRDCNLFVASFARMKRNFNNALTAEPPDATAPL